MMTLRGLREDGQYEVVLEMGAEPLFVGTYDEVVAFEEGYEHGSTYDLEQHKAYISGFLMGAL